MSDSHSETGLFPCCVCKNAIDNPHFLLDRRIEKVGVGMHKGKSVNEILIESCETLLMYCSKGCWEGHQAYVAEVLALQQTYPDFGLYTPCSRCGDPVNRTQAYICYTISEFILTGREALTGQCISDDYFAVLCKDCYPPDYGQSELVVRNDERGLVSC